MLMKDRIFLVMNVRGVVKMTKTPPAIKPNERTFVVNVLIPDKVYLIKFYKLESENKVVKNAEENKHRL